MKPPRTPPAFPELMQETGFPRLMEVLKFVDALSFNNKYLHWDKLIRYEPPAGLTHEEWWLGLRFSRTPLFKPIPLTDKQGHFFKFLVTDPIPEQLHHIDLGAGGRIGVPEPVTNPETKDQYYMSSLIEEAITSSQLEGATTTREVAKEMIRAARPPRDRSERMILNNFQTMQQIGKLKGQSLTKQLILELHRLVTEKTLSDATAAGRFRTEQENIVVGDEQGVIFHIPPPANQLEDRMAAMCDFANSKTPDYFIHPALRAIMLHFWLAYDHPFVDGNGRTARALFYWAMLHYGFWLCEFISISRILVKAPSKYGRSFLYTETDDNDLTYFILYQVDVIRRALKELHDFIKAKAARVRAMEQQLQGTLLFNHRQRALLSHALRHPQFRYTFEGHRISHNVAYQTARTDLLALQENGVLEARKVGKTWYFTPSPMMEAKLQAMA
ncbi:MAG: Fic family protein [Armatimonadetes bacterium]|nr:Fic family protein [Armatimonadota bacterium]